MITDKYSGEPISCPYCNSTEMCGHLFAFYDLTFNSIDGGYIFDKVENINSFISDYFDGYIKTNGLTKAFKGSSDQVLKDMWKEIYATRSDIIINENTSKNEFDLPVTNELIFKVLDEIVIPEKGECEGYPGQSSTYLIYYTEDPLLKYNELLDGIKDLLKHDKKPGSSPSL